MATSARPVGAEAQHNPELERHAPAVADDLGCARYPGSISPGLGDRQEAPPARSPAADLSGQDRRRRDAGPLDRWVPALRSSEVVSLDGRASREGVRDLRRSHSGTVAHRRTSRPLGSHDRRGLQVIPRCCHLGSPAGDDVVIRIQAPQRLLAPTRPMSSWCYPVPNARREIWFRLVPTPPNPANNTQSRLGAYTALGWRDATLG